MENHNFENQGTFNREMNSRYLQMLSIGGVIGTGLFLSSGYTIAQAGPFGAVAAYLFGAVMVYLVMFSLGELSVAMPVTGSFHTYATKFISPGTGFMVAWMYWLCWVVALASQFVGAAQLMQRWFPSVPIWIFAVIVFGLNTLSVGWFAKAEDALSSIKVYAIAAFIVLGTLAIFGILPFEGTNAAPLFNNITSNGLLPNGLVGFITVMLSVNYAFSGVEMIGIAAGETDNPKKAVPQAIKSTIGLLVIFFVLTIVVLAALLPMSEAGVTEAPFVLVLDKIGFPYAADIMNFIILTAILSASTSGLYASSRMLWSLANEGMISKELVKINKHGVPMRGMILSMIGVVIAWLAIPLAQIGFRREFLKNHSEDELEYKTPFSPTLPWITVVLLVISIIGIGWDPSQRAGLYFGVPFMIGCYIYHYIRFKKW
ncbi:TPA: amino acid permease [Streptococcus suis]|nr:amino acid permease [Streptococcus suis]